MIKNTIRILVIEDEEFDVRRIINTIKPHSPNSDARFRDSACVIVKTQELKIIINKNTFFNIIPHTALLCKNYLLLDQQARIIID